MKVNSLKLALFTLLGFVFILALGYTLLVLPLSIHGKMVKFFPDLFYSDPFEPWVTMEEFVDRVRWIGYASFLVVVSLMFLGFVTERKGLTSIGAGAFILPIFASSMFFMAGLGILRLLWLPLLEVCPIALRLGDSVLIPVLPILVILGLAGTSFFALWISITIVGLGMLLFSIVTWLYGGMEGMVMIDFWAYRYSRHPQYLGFVIASYGLLIRNSAIHFRDALTFPSLPWMTSTLVVICMALLEEKEMQEKHGEGYKEYREKTPFMLPLPGFISRAMTAPIRRLLGVDLPTNKRDSLHFRNLLRDFRLAFDPVYTNFSLALCSSFFV